MIPGETARDAADRISRTVQLVRGSPYVKVEPTPTQWAVLADPRLELLYAGQIGSGKMLAHDTPVLTTDGWTTHGELHPGQYVFDQDGYPTEILAVHPEVVEESLRVRFKNGCEILAHPDHYWSVLDRREDTRFIHSHDSWKSDRRASRPSVVKSQTPRPECAVVGCPHPSKTRGWCAGHYQRWTRKGNPGAADLPARSVCSVIGCSNPRFSSGGCSKHYQRLVAHGSLEGVGDFSDLLAARNTRTAAAKREACASPYVWDFTRVVTTSEMRELNETEAQNIRIPYGLALRTEGKWESSIDPYVLGFWLGDGTTANSNVTVGRADADQVKLLLPEESVWRLPKDPDRAWTATLPIRHELSAEGQIGNKHIPEWVYLAPYEDRLSLFQGIMDTDGYVSPEGRMALCMAREGLLRDIWRLAHTLGLNPTRVRHKATSNQYPEFKGEAWLFEFRTETTVFRLPRKVGRQRAAFAGVRRNLVVDTIVPGPVTAMRCISVANPRGMYRVGYEQVVTHNTVMLLAAALMYVHIPGYNALILRRSFPALSQQGGLMQLADSWLHNTDAKRGDQGKRWTFPSGATLRFDHLETDADRLKHDGASITMCGFDEVSQISELAYTFLFSRVRRPTGNTDLGSIPLRMRACGNPTGKHAGWVVDRFVKPIAPSPDRVFYPSQTADNTHLDLEEYRRSLAKLDPFTRRQMEDGDWEAKPEGLMFSPESFRYCDGAVPAPLRRIRVWDLAASEEMRSDFSAGVLMALTNQGEYVVEHIVRAKLEPGALEKLIRATADADGRGVPVVLEKQPGAAGLMVMRDFKQRVLSDRMVHSQSPTGSKVDRAMLPAALASQGKLVLRKASWNYDCVSEMSSFPDSLHDDQCDGISLGCHFLSKFAPRSFSQPPEEGAEKPSDGPVKPKPPARLHRAGGWGVSLPGGRGAGRGPFRIG